MKAVRSIELGLETLTVQKLVDASEAEIMAMLTNSDDERAFVVYEAIKRGVSMESITAITKIDMWFLDKMRHLVVMEKDLQEKELTPERIQVARELGFLDKTITELSGQTITEAVKQYASFKMVDTCAGEFEARTPYFYSTRDSENEAALFIKDHASKKERILVLGSGPIRIGQGIEFDYCSVHCVWALREKGYEAIIINNNPETVSTDFDTSDRLYFEPLTKEDVRSVVETEKPKGAIVQFGGQTAIKLTRYLEAMGVPVLGTSPKNIDAAEDREVFDQLLERCAIPRPQGETVFTTAEAVDVAEKLGFPVLLRPSYVLGGQNMIIAYEAADVVEYMDIITSVELENPVLIDKYLMGKEVEVDAICDGDDYLIPGIMEHIERAGVHSGDSISVYPPQTLSQSIKDTIVDYTGRLAKALAIVGLVNIQYVIYDEQVYVIEVNPRSSRTVPYISKVTDIPMVNLATKMMLGEKLRDLGYQSGIHPEGDYVAVKVPVFSFEKLQDVDAQLGPEMKSTGEVLGVAKTFADALYKGLVAAGNHMERNGGVLLTVRDRDKKGIVDIGRQFYELGFTIYATVGTALILNENQIPAKVARRMSERQPNIGNLLESGKVNYVISTSTKGRMPQNDSVRMRRKSVESSISLLTSLDTAQALLDCLKSNRTMEKIELVDIHDI